MGVVEALVAADEGDTREGLAFLLGIDAAAGQAVAVGVEEEGTAVGEEGVEQDARLGEVEDVVLLGHALVKLLVTEDLLAHGEVEVVAVDVGVEAGHGEAAALDGVKVCPNGGDGAAGCVAGPGARLQAAAVEGDGAGRALEDLLLGGGLLLAVDIIGDQALLVPALVDVDDLDHADDGVGGPGVAGGELFEHAQGHGDDVVLLHAGEVLGGHHGMGVEGGVVGIDEQGTMVEAAIGVGELADGAAAHEGGHGLGQGEDGGDCLFHCRVAD